MNPQPVLEGNRFFRRERCYDKLPVLNRASRATLGATPEEEVWVEVDAYRDAADSLRVIAEIGKDPAAGLLFAEVLRLATPAVLAAQGNANRVHP